MYRRLIKPPWAINNAAWQRFTSKHGSINLYKKVNLTLESFRRNFEIKVETCNMFIKLILIATFVNFVCVRSIENEVQHLSLFVESHPGTIMDTESTKTVNILLCFLYNFPRENYIRKDLFLHTVNEPLFNGTN